MAPHTGAVDTSGEARGKVVTRMGTQQYNNQDRSVMNLCHLNHGLYCVQSGVLPKSLDTNYFFLYLLSLIMCERVGKKNAGTFCLMHQSIFRPINIFNNDAYFVDFCAQEFLLIFFYLNPFNINKPCILGF